MTSSPVPIAKSTRSRTSTKTSKPTMKCPVLNCDMTFFTNKLALIQTHFLSKAHINNERRSIPASFYTNTDVYKCPICPPARLILYASNKTLTNHVNKTHKTETRTTSNSEITMSHFPATTSDNETSIHSN